jgi:hypothetical protein
MTNEKFSPGLVMKDGTSVQPTNIEWLIAFAIKGNQWAIDALPEAIDNAKLMNKRSSNKKSMTNTIKITMTVNLLQEVPDNSEVVRDVVDAILNGEIHPLVEETELVEFSTED